MRINKTTVIPVNRSCVHFSFVVGAHRLLVSISVGKRDPTGSQVEGEVLWIFPQALAEFHYEMTLNCYDTWSYVKLILRNRWKLVVDNEILVAALWIQINTHSVRMIRLKIIIISEIQIENLFYIKCINYKRINKLIWMIK